MVDKVLVVQPAGQAPPAFPGVEASWLEYRFTRDQAPGPLAAWEVERQGRRRRVEVLEVCRPLPGGFRQQALNRHFAAMVQDCRPELVIVRGLYGCTLDLVRLADLMGVPVWLDVGNSRLPGVDGSELEVESLDRITTCWLQDCLRHVRLLLHDGHVPRWADDLLLPEDFSCAPAASLWERVLPAKEPGTPPKHITDNPDSHQEEDAPTTAGFDYSLYEFLLRDHPLLMRMQAAEVQLLAGCKNVLDLGCGAGLFLQLLDEAGIAAQGVERNPVIAAYGRGMGFDIATADALEFVAQARGFDGVYCSHFIEHLPTEVVQLLLSRMARALEPGGVLVLAFPDPESIRSQLLGFWRDPEHVRFYHPELVTALATAYGFELEWSSYQDQPHEVASFPLTPPPVTRLVAPEILLDSGPMTPATGARWWRRLLGRVGLATVGQQREMEHQLARLEASVKDILEQQQRVATDLTERTERLWAVNRTWGWNDNAILKLRKRA